MTVNTNNIIQTRYLFDKAINFWEPNRDITNGITVSLLQDAAEMLVWAIVKQCNIDVKNKEIFISLLDKCDTAGKSLQFKAQIREVNSARVNFKHYGNVPATSDVPKFIENTRKFLIENSRIFLDLNFEEVSLADAIENETLRSLLKEADILMKKGELEESLIKCSIAYKNLVSSAIARHYKYFPDISDAHKLFPKEKQDDARQLISQFSDFFNQFVKEYAMFSLGVSKTLFEEIEQRTLVVNISASGKRLGVYSNKKSDVSIANINFLLSNLIEISQRI